MCDKIDRLTLEFHGAINRLKEKKTLQPSEINKNELLNICELIEELEEECDHILGFPIAKVDRLVHPTWAVNLSELWKDANSLYIEVMYYAIYGQSDQNQ